MKKLSIKLWLIQSILKVRPALIGSLLQKIFFPRREVIKAKGLYFSVNPASNLGYNLINKGTYEPDMIACMEDLLKPEDVFIDLGANEGFFSIIGSQLVGKKGKIIAIEPQARLQEVIKRNIDLNNCENTTIMKTIVSNHNQNMELYLTPNLNSGASSIIRPTKYKLPTENVPTMTLNQIFTKKCITHCKLLKIDIEGGEYEAILGALPLLKNKKIENIALELHPNILSKRELCTEDVIEPLKDSGYILNKNYCYSKNSLLFQVAK